MLTTVFKAQQHIEDKTQAFADHSRLEASLKTKYVVFATAQEDWKQNTSFYETESVEL